jgi:hypothetical protein
MAPGLSSQHKVPSAFSTASFSERVRNMSPDEIKIPPEPPGRCSNHLQVSTGLAAEAHVAEMAWALSACAVSFRGHGRERDQVTMLLGRQEPAVSDTSFKPELRN